MYLHGNGTELRNTFVPVKMKVPTNFTAGRDGKLRKCYFLFFLFDYFELFECHSEEFAIGFVLGYVYQGGEVALELFEFLG